MDILQTYSNPAFQFANGTQMESYANQGNVFYVRPSSGSDGQDGKSPQTAFKTLATALAACTANQNDIVYLMAESNTGSATTNYLSSNLLWNKDGVHLIGVNAGTLTGQRSRIASLSTATSFANLFTVSANNCLIANIEFFQGAGSTTLSAAQTAVTVSGMRNRIVNCQISGIGDTTVDYANSNSLTVSGSENTIQHCYIGLDTVIRATSVTEVIISGTATRNVFEDCVIDSYTSGTTFKAVTFTGATGHTFTLFKSCTMNCEINRTGVVTTTGAISTGSISGSVLLLNTGVFGYSNVTTSNDTKTLVSAPIGASVKAGLGTGYLTA